MTPDDIIKEARKLLSEATPGKWECECARESPQSREYALYYVRAGCAHWTPNTPPYTLEQMQRDRADAEFIAFARNYLPSILDAYTRTEQALEVMRKALEFYKKANWGMDISAESVQEYCRRAYNDRGHSAAMALAEADRILKGEAQSELKHFIDAVKKTPLKNSENT